jgi:hypothetical protein
VVHRCAIIATADDEANPAVAAELFNENRETRPG